MNATIAGPEGCCMSPVLYSSGFKRRSCDKLAQSILGSPEQPLALTAVKSSHIFSPCTSSGRRFTLA